MMREAAGFLEGLEERIYHLQPLLSVGFRLAQLPRSLGDCSMSR